MDYETNIKPQNSSRRFNTAFLALIIVLSLIFGAFGGAFGLVLASRNPQIQKMLIAGTIVNQKISLSESSAVIDVVKKASPAVVSIVISQDVSKVPAQLLISSKLGPAAVSLFPKTGLLLLTSMWWIRQEVVILSSLMTAKVIPRLLCPWTPSTIWRL
jgi:hypothetical protein